jgi:hypothetical protein
MTALVVFLACIGGYSLGRATIGLVLNMFFDREGNSGRHRHWSEE